MEIAIIGGGMTGLSAAYELAKRGFPCAIYEREEELGGLVSSFQIDGVRLEKFYHHIFNHDSAMVELIEDLGLKDRLEWKRTVTSYYANRLYRLTTPLDVLLFKPLSLVDRFRLGLMTLRARFIREWQSLEDMSARDWIIKMAGPEVYHKVWEPLLRGKFGRYQDEVGAVWFWNKLKLRGSSRGRSQAEELGYLRGGFGLALEALEKRLRQMGAKIYTAKPVQKIIIEHGKVKGVVCADGFHPYEVVLVTTAPKIFLEMAPELPQDYRARLEKIHYLANVCLILKLKKSLSDTYWLNLNDPSIPFVAVVEHTNMQRPEEYGGHHLVYLSRYMDPEDRYYSLSAEELLAEYLPHLKKLFPAFQEDWVEDSYAWRDPYTQPIIVRNYSQLKPPFHTPVKNLWLCCMAQIYPEDRGLNYSIVYAKRAVTEMMESFR